MARILGISFRPDHPVGEVIAGIFPIRRLKPKQCLNDEPVFIQAATTAEFIIGLYRQFGGNDYIGEPVSQIEHMCQCAHLAEEEGYDDEIILAAFFMISVTCANTSWKLATWVDSV